MSIKKKKSTAKKVVKKKVTTKKKSTAKKAVKKKVTTKKKSTAKKAVKKKATRKPLVPSLREILKDEPEKNKAASSLFEMMAQDQNKPDISSEDVLDDFTKNDPPTEPYDDSGEQSENKAEAQSWSDDDENQDPEYYEDFESDLLDSPDEDDEESF